MQVWPMTSAGSADLMAMRTVLMPRDTGGRLSVLLRHGIWEMTSG